MSAPAIVVLGFLAGCAFGLSLGLLSISFRAAVLRRAAKRFTAREEEPWSLDPAKCREGFRVVRDAVPVDDEEMRRAKPACKPFRWSL